MVRKINSGDKDVYLEMSKEFYVSDAVLSNIPEKHITGTFKELMDSTPYADAYIIEYGGSPAGYALIAVTYSNEAGGIVVWIEEIYIRDGFRGKGLGTELMKFIEEQYKGKAVKIRLEIEAGNEQAARLYKRLGFENLDYIQMHKKL